MCVSWLKVGYAQGYPQPCSQENMWPFTRKPQETLELYRKLLWLESRIDELEAKHSSLRGRVYSAGIHKNPIPDSEEARIATVPRSKDELRRLAGIVPGKPYKHQE